MISIKANGTFLTIDPASGIDYTIVNSFFNDDLMEQEFSLPFTLPMDPVNRAALGFRDRLDAIPRGSVIPCTVYFLNAPRLEADLYVLRGSDEALEVNLKSRIMGILDLLDDTPLRNALPDIVVPDVLDDYEGIVIEPMVKFGVQCAIVLDGKGFYSSIGTKEMRGIALAAAINATYPGSTTYDVIAERLTIIPTWSPVNYDFSFGRQIIVHKYETPAQYWYRNFHAWVSQINADTNADICFPMVMNRGYYKENAVWAGSINPRPELSYGEHGDLYFEATSWKYSYSPWTKVTAALDYIAAAVANLDAFIGPVLEEDNVKRLITSNLKPLDEVARENYPNDWDKLGQGDDDEQPTYIDIPLHLNHFKQRFNLADYIGDMSCKDFLYLVADSLRLQMTYSNNIIYFRKKIATVTAPISRTLPRFRGRPVIEYNEVFDWSLYLFRPDPDKDKTSYPDALGPIDIGAGGEPRTLSHGTIPMTEIMGADPSHPRPKYPELNILNTDMPNGSKGLLLLSWYGIQPGWIEDTSYAFASSGYSNEVNIDVGEMALDLQDILSIYNLYLKGTFQYDVSDTITDGGMYSPYEIDEASWFRARVKGYSERGEYVGMVRSITIRITARGEMESTFEVAKQRI